MKGWVDDRADDEERQKGREYERRKALKERGRDREVSSGFFLAPHFSSPSAFQSKLASTDRLRSNVFILLARGAKKVKLLIKGNTGETSQICTSYQQLYRAWGTLKHECVHARVCVLSVECICFDRLPHWLVFRKCIPRASKSESGSLSDRLEAFSRTDGFLVNEK